MIQLARSCREDGDRYERDLSFTEQSLGSALESLVVDSLARGGYTRQISPNYLEVAVVDLPSIDLFIWSGCLFEMKPLIVVTSFVSESEAVPFNQSATALYLEESVVQAYVALALVSGFEKNIRDVHLRLSLLCLSAGGLNCISASSFKRAMNMQLRDLIPAVLLSAETERMFLEICDQLGL
jgi:hypothetical protein